MNSTLNTKNYESMMNYIDNLFLRYARLLVLRLDLSYRKNVDNPYMTENEFYAAYWQAKHDKEHLFNNMRTNQLFDHMVGNIWRLEYGTDKGFHYHCIFFFDGSQVREDIPLANRIGQYWSNNITQGRGLYHNCNLHKDDYNRCGIGMMNWNDFELIDNLKSATRYLVKPDDYLNTFTNNIDIGRTFGRGTIQEKTETRGRPRQRNVLSSLETGKIELVL
jgi:hypothetical protein